MYCSVGAPPFSVWWSKSHTCSIEEKFCYLFFLFHSNFNFKLICLYQSRVVTHLGRANERFLKLANTKTRANLRGRPQSQAKRRSSNSSLNIQKILRQPPSQNIVFKLQIQSHKREVRSVSRIAYNTLIQTLAILLLNRLAQQKVNMHSYIVDVEQLTSRTSINAILINVALSAIYSNHIICHASKYHLHDTIIKAQVSQLYTYHVFSISRFKCTQLLLSRCRVE